MAVRTQPAKRTESRAKRRRQLINATIRCIARRGLSGTTMGEVARVAGLSQGIVNLHFQSKDNLLTETLRFLSDEYKALFERTLAQSGPGAAEKLLALMQLDLKPSVCDRQKLAVWFAFWGEAKSVPTYQKICDAHDREYDEVMLKLCESIINDGRYKGVNAQQVVDALSSMTDGLWLAALIRPKSWDRHEAFDAVYSYLGAVFPRHYS
ncbi:MAG: TetR family transcriptional regulator C-terminal domain-containing protein [Gammaproteobacteria bacterium]|nr:TetR family transcriptional regulator C-terminal domain-containing protein [Gammaproteobacteria bacterium]